MSALKTGDRVGRYVVVGPLAGVGRGEVYKGFDPQLNRGVTLKLLDLAPRPGIEKVEHPALAAIWEVGSFEGRVFLALEAIEGAPLRSWLAQGRSWQEVVEVFLTVGRALVAAQAAGFSHGDFSAESVVVGREGEVKVLDLGLAPGADDLPAFGAALAASLPATRPAWVDAIATGRFVTLDALVRALSADPSRLRRRNWIAAAGLVTIAAITWGAVRSRTPDCLPAQRLSGVWDPELKTRLTQRFLETGRLGADDAADRVIRQLDRWADSWVSEATAACLPANAAANPCLDRRLAELSAVATLLSNADKSVVDRAVSAARSLTLPTRCKDPRTVSGMPSDEALTARLEAARARREAGLITAATEAAKTISDEASLNRQDELRAEALRLLGKDALPAAISSGSRYEVFEAATSSGKFAEAERVLAELGSDGVLQAELLEARAKACAPAPDDCATAPLRQAIELRHRLLGDEHPDTLRARFSLASALEQLGQLPESAEAEREALEASRRSLGRDNRSLIAPSCHLCRSMLTLGRAAEALTLCEDGVRLAAAIDGEKSGLHGTCLAGLAAIAAASGQGQPAVDLADRAEGILRVVYGADAVEPAEAQLTRARGLAMIGKPDDAADDLARARAQAERHLAPTDPRLADFLLAQAELSLNAHRPSPALEPAERALRLREHAFAGSRAEARWVYLQALWQSDGDKVRAVEQARLTLDELQGLPGLAAQASRTERWLSSVTSPR